MDTLFILGRILLGGFLIMNGINQAKISTEGPKRRISPVATSPNAQPKTKMPTKKGTTYNPICQTSSSYSKNARTVTYKNPRNACTTLNNINPETSSLFVKGAANKLITLRDHIS